MWITSVRGQNNWRLSGVDLTASYCIFLIVRASKTALILLKYLFDKDVIALITYPGTNLFQCSILNPV